MRTGYRAIRLADGLRAIRLAKGLFKHDSWTREQLEAHQRRMLEETERYARAHSPFWRDRLAGGPTPMLDKATLMEHFDDAVTDRRLSSARLEAHIAEMGTQDALLDGDFRVMATSGTTGYRGVFVYSRAEWVGRIAFALRTQSWSGAPSFRRRRVAVVVVANPLHISARYTISTDIGLHKVRHVDLRTPLSEMVAAVREHRPDQIVTVPSALAMLAEEQAAGRLGVDPEFLGVTGEMLTEGMETAIRDAWPRARLTNIYSTTELGMTAAVCEHEDGLHLFEDLAIFENVDEDRNAVPDGEVGSSLLVTDLAARAQPKIRYALADAVAITSDPCPCGRPYRRLVSIAGRSDDVLELPALAGGTVRMHPVVLRSPMAAQSGVLQYQVVHEHDGLHVLAVPRGRADPAETVRAVGTAVDDALQAAGAEEVVHVHLVAELERHAGHGAKVKVVSSRRA